MLEHLLNITYKIFQMRLHLFKTIISFRSTSEKVPYISTALRQFLRKACSAEVG